VHHQESCLGLIETDNLSAALEAADTMLKLKPQTVTFFQLIIVGAGHIAVLILGKTGEVQAAIEAGSKAAQRKGTVLAQNVIPRCADLIGHLAEMDSAGET
jgi:microcompartment protein CcmL/EutN